MTEIRTSVVMNLLGNFEQRAQRNAQAMGVLGRSGEQNLGRLGRLSQSVGRGLDALGNKYTALLTGAAGVGTFRGLSTLEDRFTRLGIQADQSNEQMAALRQQIFDMARAPDIRVDPSEITSAIEAIVEKTGDLEFAQNNIRNIGLAISATGAQGQNIGDIFAEFQKQGITSQEAILMTIDTLNEQGKAGAFTLQNLAALGSRVVTAYTAMGRSGPQAMREMGAALQVIRQGTGSSEMAATAFEALLRTFQDADKVKLLQKGGIQVFDTKELEKGRQVLRPVNELMVEIIEKSKGRTTVLSNIFDAEALRAFNAAIGEYQRTGSVESLRKFLNVQGDGAATMKDSARAAATMSGAMRNLASAWNQFADENLSELVQDAADALNSLDKETVDRWLTIATVGAGLVGVAVAGKAAANVVGGVAKAGRMVFGKKGAGGLGGALGDAMTGGAIPVYVVNWGGAGGGLPGGVAGRVPGRGGPRVFNPLGSLKEFGRFSRLPVGAIAGFGAKGLAAAGLGVGAAGLAGYGIGSLLNEYAINGTEVGRKLGDNYGRGIARILSAFGNDNATAALQAERDAGTLTIKVDQDGRLKSVTAKKGRTGMDMDVDLGITGLVD